MIREPTEILMTLLAAAWRRRMLVFFPALIFPFIALFASFIIPRTYEARTTLLVQEPSKLNPFLNDLSIGPNVKDRMQALDALLHSEHVLDQVLQDVGLINANTPISDKYIMVDRLKRTTSVRLIGTDLVELRVSDKQPGQLMPLLMAVTKRFVDRLLSPEQSAIVDSQVFLDGQLTSRRAALEESERNYSEFKTRNADKLPAIYAANITRLGGLQQKLEERQMDLAAADAAFEDMRGRLASTNPVIGRLEESIVSVSSELTALRTRYTEEHSEVQTLDRKLNRLKEERRALVEASQALKDTDLDRLWNMAAGSAANIEESGANAGKQSQPTLLVSQMVRLQEMQGKRIVLKQDVEQLRKTLGDLQHTMTQFAPIEQEQQRHERAIASSRETFETLQKRFEMARVTGALGRFEAPERIKMIDPPSEPTAPIGAGAMLFMLAGLVAGLGMGGGLAFIAELLDQRIRLNSVFTYITGVPVVARVPRARTLRLA
jgi:polysaccharide chain length determinant protein (PEP-CTERM system associated)